MATIQQLCDINNQEYDLNIAKILNDITISENIKTEKIKKKEADDEYMFIDEPKKTTTQSFKKPFVKKTFVKKTYSKKPANDDDDDYMFS